MWVERRVAHIKRGRMQEAVELLDSHRVEGYTVRLLTARTGKEAGATLVIEIEYPSIEEYDQALAAMLATPEGMVFHEKWDELNDRTMTRELYRVVG